MKKIVIIFLILFLFTPIAQAGALDTTMNKISELKSIIGLEEAKNNSDNLIPINNSSSTEHNILPIQTPPEDSTQDNASFTEKVFAKGIVGAIKLLCNDFLSASYGIKVPDIEGSNVTGLPSLVIGIAGYRLYPYACQPVLDILYWSYGLFLFGAGLLILGGAAYFYLQQTRKGFGSKVTEYIYGVEKLYTFGSYFETWVILVLWELFAVAGVWMVLYINDVIVSGILVSVADQIEFSSQNLSLYFIMSFGYLVLSIWVFMRIFFIYYFSAYVLVFGLLVAWPKTREIGSVFVVYFIGIVAMQPIYVSVISFSVALAHSGIMLFRFTSQYLYTAAILFLFGVGLVVVAWPIVYLLVRSGIAKTGISLLGKSGGLPI